MKSPYSREACALQGQCKLAAPSEAIGDPIHDCNMRNLVLPTVHRLSLTRPPTPPNFSLPNKPSDVNCPCSFVSCGCIPCQQPSQHSTLITGPSSIIVVNDFHFVLIPDTSIQTETELGKVVRIPQDSTGLHTIPIVLSNVQTPTAKH